MHRHCASSQNRVCLGRTGHSAGCLGGSGLQASEIGLMVTKRPVVLTGHVPEVQNAKKLRPSGMGSTFTHRVWRENGVPHLQAGYTRSDSSSAGKWLRLKT